MTKWGEAWELGTAAFWIQQARELSSDSGRHRLGTNLREEVAACILGGHGIQGPVGLAAFSALRDAGLLEPGLCEQSVSAAMINVLEEPLRVGPRRIRYRFHQQRPKRLAAALSALGEWEHDADGFADSELRDRLILLPGIGPKTASWVVRNYRDSDKVAIIDIHINRAGVNAGIFCADWSLPRDYRLFEHAFLTWAAAGEVSAANLDAAIWRLMFSLGRLGKSSMVYKPRQAAKELLMLDIGR